MSAKIIPKTGSVVPFPTGGITPDCANALIKPTAFSNTVLPPVFGPLTTTTRSFSFVSRSNGTTTSNSASSNGWRPLRITIGDGASTTVGRHPSTSRAYRARAYRSSTRTHMFHPSAIRSASGRANSVQSRSTWRTTRRSVASHALSSFPSATASWGSMNKVAPEPDSPWTIPLTLERASRLTGITYRPLRIVTPASTPEMAEENRSIRPWSSPTRRSRVVLKLRRASLRSSEALSLTLPSTSIAAVRRRPNADGGGSTARA